MESAGYPRKSTHARIICEILAKNEYDVIIFSIMTSADTHAATTTQDGKASHAYSDLLLAESAQEGLRKGLRTELRLRWAACQLLNAHSLSNVKIADLCKLAEVSQGTFYLYFTDRDALLRSLLEAFVRHLSTSMAAAAKSAQSRQEAALISTKTYCLLFAQNRGLMKCLLHHYDSFTEARGILQDFNRSWIEGVVDSLLRGRGKPRRGMTTRQDLLRRCYALGGMVDQYLSYIFLAEDANVVAVAGDIDTMAATLDHIWRQALKQELGT